MFSSFFGIPPTPKETEHKEGDFYKTITAHGKSFDIYYGYYEDWERESPNCKPLEMYPNFIETPVYTDKGIPFVTGMQKACDYFKGERDEDSTCIFCAHYEKCEELLGICKCPKRRKKAE